MFSYPIYIAQIYAIAQSIANQLSKKPAIPAISSQKKIQEGIL
jgi:hypothetical protein